MFFSKNPRGPPLVPDVLWNEEGIVTFQKCVSGPPRQASPMVFGAIRRGPLGAWVHRVMATAFAQQEAVVGARGGECR